MTTVMGDGRLWAQGLLALDTYLRVQFWAALFVFVACVPQMTHARKFRWPPEPGRISITLYCLGFRLQEAATIVPLGRWSFVFCPGSPRLTLALGDIGARLDFVAIIVGRVGIALQAIVALFAIDDVLANPPEPRPMISWMLLAVAMIQVRSLTAHAPSNTALAAMRSYADRYRGSLQSERA